MIFLSGSVVLKFRIGHISSLAANSSKILPTWGFLGTQFYLILGCNTEYPYHFYEFFSLPARIFFFFWSW